MAEGVRKRLNSTVLVCLAAFFFVYVTVVTCVIVPWLSFSVPGALNLLFLTCNAGTALICFLVCVFSDAGGVPSDWSPDAEVANTVIQVKKKDGESRFCQKCQQFKPPRAHHCKICKRCVLRMDHHCPWINNCVGHNNYKAFVLFLLYVNAAVVHALGLLIAHALYMLNMHSENRDYVVRTGPTGTTMHVGMDQASMRSAMGWALLQTVCTALTLPLALGLLVLLVWNGYLLYYNKTTIEYYEGVTARVQALRTGREYRHPYDLGPCGNLHAALGQKPTSWFLPLQPSADGDGLLYPSPWDDIREGL